MPPLYHVDAFADRPFTGNPAAVVVLDDEADAAWMQRVAAEMNLAETAFVRPTVQQHGASGAAWHLRWFSPAAEVELCGHATLAAAHVLWQTGRAPHDAPIHFQTRYRGTLTCSRQAGPEPAAVATGGGPDHGPLITMAFPADPPTDTPAPPELLEALQPIAAPVNVARARYDWIVELPHADDVRNYQPDFPALAAVDCRGIALTARAESAPGAAGVTFDVISRFFAPRLRIDEDAVTGSLHCALGPYWSPRLGRPTLHCHQASARGGDLYVTTRADHVDLAGRAATVAHGELLAAT